MYNADLALAFERLDWKVWLLSEEDIYKWLVRGEKPDLVLNNILNPLIHDLCEKKQIPHVYWVLDSWTQSPNLMNEEQQAQAVSLGFPVVHTRVPLIPDGRYLYSFSVSQELLPMLKGQAQVYLPFHVNASRFQPMGLPKKYDVGFIGTSLQGLDHIDGVTILERAGVGLDQIGLIEDIPTRVSWQMLVGMRESADARVKACQAAKATVWGDGWDKVEGVTRMGRTDFKKTLPSTINECVVNLNSSRSIFPNDVCPRVLEVLACQGVLLTNNIPGIWSEFRQVSQMYTDADDLKDRLDFLLDPVSQDERERMGGMGRQLILDGWTWEHAAKKILSVVYA